jgi:hypothetical protein
MRALVKYLRLLRNASGTLFCPSCQFAAAAVIDLARKSPAISRHPVSL